MEYSHFHIDAGQTEHISCDNCGSDFLSILAKIKYGFFFLEFLPFCIVGKELSLNCQQCGTVYSSDILDSDIYRRLKKQTFKLRHILPMYSGLLLLILALVYWRYDIYQERLLTQSYIDAPHSNDFYFIDYQLLSKSQRPEKDLRLAKVSSVGSNSISLIFGRFMYSKLSSLESDIRGGMVIDSRYFSSERRQFTTTQLSQLEQEGVVIKVERPINGVLYGTSVIAATIEQNDKSLPYLYNQKGLAFYKNAHIEDNLNNAFKYFLKSAELDFTEGQINLSQWYINQGQHEEALIWLEKASLKGSKLAIQLYLDNCSLAKNCELKSFKNKISEQGFNLSLNR